MKKIFICKNLFLFSFLLFLFCSVIIGSSVAFAYYSYSTPYVNETHTFVKDFAYTFTTNTNETTFNYDTVVSVSASNKVARTSVSFPQGYIVNENDCTIYVYAKVVNKNGAVTKTNSANSITLGLSGNFERIVTTSSLGTLAYAGSSQHDVELYYFTDSDSLLGADVTLYYQ